MRKVIVFLFVVGLISFSQPSSSSEPLVVSRHEVTVIDGDTIQIGKTVYQLAGVDAPELGQACNHDGHLWLCGLAAGHSLHKQLEMESMPINCFIQSRTGTLPLASCMIGDQEISVILLKGGHVTALPDAPPHYAAAEHMAKQGTLGIWNGTFIPPRKWREGKRLPNKHKFKGSSHPTAKLPWKEIEKKFLHLESKHTACMVKGDISSENEYFYYGPLDPEYVDIVIDLKKDERFFCGDDEARKAGWRRKGEGPAKKE